MTTGLGNLLFGAEGDDRDVVVHAGDDAWTRRRLRDRATDIACALADAGVAPHTAVGVMLPNGPDVVATLFGVWRAGGVYVPLNPRLTDDEVRHVLASVSPAAVVATGDDAGRLARLSGLPVVVPEDGPVSVLPPGSPPVEAAGHGEDVALVQFTSGTTGTPKPVLLTHDGVLALMDGVVRKLRSSGGSGPATRAPMPNLVPLSLSLWAGLYNVIFALRVGAPVVVMDGFDTRDFADLVRRHDIRSTVLPPAAMAMLSDDTGIDDLAPLRYVRSITAPLSPLQARRFRDRFGITVLNCYGQTEIGGEIVGWNAADAREHPDKLGAVGRPHEGVKIRVVDEAGTDEYGTDLPAGEVGELWVQTPALAAGYAGGTDLSDRLSPDGWFRTGDLGRVDAEGFVWIDGRVSDMVNRGGLKVFPAEVEEVVRLSPAVADAAVVGVPDDRLGEVPWAFVVGDVDPSALEALCRAHLAPYKVPVRFEAVEALPRNEVGKVLKADLARRAAAAR